MFLIFLHPFHLSLWCSCVGVAAWPACCLGTYTSLDVFGVCSPTRVTSCYARVWAWGTEEAETLVNGVFLGGGGVGGQGVGVGCVPRRVGGVWDVPSWGVRAWRAWRDARGASESPWDVESRRKSRVSPSLLLLLHAKELNFFFFVFCLCFLPFSSHIYFKRDLIVLLWVKLCRQYLLCVFYVFLVWLSI